jgi:hypothetical protein
MTGITFDTGALIALERRRARIERLRAYFPAVRVLAA